MPPLSLERSPDDINSTPTLYSFFVLLGLLFWNPLAYFLLYGDTPVYALPAVQGLYWFVFVAGIAAVVLIEKEKLSEPLRNGVLMLAFTGILFSVLFAADRLIGLLRSEPSTREQTTAGIIFEPGSTARYQTVEYDFSVEANNVGLRDNDVAPDKGGKFRILAFGDSWTMGWGVSLEESWPKKLEEFLRTHAYENVEVINCGQGGQYTATYKQYMQAAVPLLKPDLVLIGVLQMDDLAQLYENGELATPREPQGQGRGIGVRTIVADILEYLKFSFRNILALFVRIDIHGNWQAWATSTIDELTTLQRVRFSTLDATVQDLYRNGDLNPGILQEYLKFPDRMAVFNNPEHPATKMSIQAMDRDIKEMKKIVQAQNAALVFVNLPTHPFTGHEVVNSPSDVLNPFFRDNNHVDAIYRSIADGNEVPYIELTEHFLGLENKSDYFFRYDGHPNSNGYAEIASHVGQQLMERELLQVP